MSYKAAARYRKRDFITKRDSRSPFDDYDYYYDDDDDDDNNNDNNMSIARGDELNPAAHTAEYVIIYILPFGFTLSQRSFSALAIASHPRVFPGRGCNNRN